MTENINTKDDYNKVMQFRFALISYATGNHSTVLNYETTRQWILNHPVYSEYVPSWITHVRDASQFWQFIKQKFQHYDERRKFLTDEIEPLLHFIDSQSITTPLQSQAGILHSLDCQHITSYWTKLLTRVESDPEGAITAARPLLETICKTIIEKREIDFKKNNPPTEELYATVSNDLNLSPAKQENENFKKILGGCNSIVSGISALRNIKGDAHGKSIAYVPPTSRQARLILNATATLCIFLSDVYELREEQKQ